MLSHFLSSYFKISSCSGQFLNCENLNSETKADPAEPAKTLLDEQTDYCSFKISTNLMKMSQNLIFPHRYVKIPHISGTNSLISKAQTHKPQKTLNVLMSLTYCTNLYLSI